MAQIYENEATVYIWTYRGLGHFGHASVKMHRGSTVDYVSWWPKGGAGLLNCFERVRPTSLRTYKRDMNSEISEETEENLERGVFKLLPNQRRWLDEDGDVTYGKAADHKVKMPGLGAKQLPFGLDVTRMSQWWNVFRHNPKSTYTLCSRHLNCSGVVVTALKAGGAESFVKAPTARLFLDPNQVRRWAEAVRDEINRLNENAKRMALVLNETKLSTPSKGAPWGNNDLMSYDDWMRYSKINSFMSVRSPEVLKMDRYVREYHGLNWETAADQKVQMLGKLMETIAQYLSQKSNSKRSQAVLDLGNQVMAVAIMLPMFRKLPPVAWAQN